MGVLVRRNLLFGLDMWAPDLWELPSSMYYMPYTNYSISHAIYHIGAPAFGELPCGASWRRNNQAALRRQILGISKIQSFMWLRFVHIEQESYHPTRDEYGTTALWQASC